MLPVSDTRMRRRTTSLGSCSRGTSPQRTWPALYRPSRSATAAVSSGSSATSAVSCAGDHAQPAVDVDEVGVDRRLVGGHVGVAQLRLEASTVQMRPAATNARIHLFAASVAVRSGSMRNAA